MEVMATKRSPRKKIEEMIVSYFVKYGVINNLDDTQHDLVDG